MLYYHFYRYPAMPSYVSAKVYRYLLLCYHVIVTGFNTGNLILICAYAQVKVDIVFRAYLIQFLQEDRETFQSDVCLF